MKRKLKVFSQYQGNKAVPTIIIKGEWVKTANFKEGDYVELDVSDERKQVLNGSINANWYRRWHKL